MAARRTEEKQGRTPPAQNKFFSGLAHIRTSAPANDRHGGEKGWLAKIV